MPFYYAQEDELSVVGLRCLVCDTFLSVAQGAFIPLCCWKDNLVAFERAEPFDQVPDLKVPRLELHLMTCVNHCSPECRCPCHEYRPKPIPRKGE